MKIQSVNIGQKRDVPWRGNTVKTGIYKESVSGPILLGKEDVGGDHVVDRRYHGGVDKACYVYGANHYSHWQELHPAMEVVPGVMGENITVESCDEASIRIGTIYQVGEAVVEVVQPRQPCFKLGIKFGTQQVLKQFIQYQHPGVYLRVLEEGRVRAGDTFTEKDVPADALTVQDLFKALYEEPDPQILELISRNMVIPSDLRTYVIDKYSTS